MRYKSERINFGESFVSRNEHKVKRAEARYPPKAEILVYYDPDNPAFSVLEPGVIWDSLWAGYFFLFFGVIFTAAGFSANE